MSATASEAMSLEDKLEQQRMRYAAAAHAMQSGVATEMHTPGGQRLTEPKHLRVGINSALVDTSGLAQLLMDKGLITQLEYFTAIADAMVGEHERYERELSEHFGSKITLR